MKTLLSYALLANCLLAMSVGFAQEYTLDWGSFNNYTKDVRRSLVPVDYRDGNYYVVAGSRKRNALLTFDETHRIIDTKNTDFIYRGKDHPLTGFVQTSAGTFAYCVPNGALGLLVKSYEAGEFGETHLVFEHDYSKGLHRAESIIELDKVKRMVLSNNKQRVAFVNNLTRSNLNIKDGLAMVVLDENMNTVWSRVHKFDQKGITSIQLVQYTVDNDGAIYLLVRERGQESRQNDISLPDYLLKVFRFTEEDLQEYAIEISEGLMATEARISFQKERENVLSITGLYIDTSLKEGIQGVFCNHLDFQNEVTETRYVPFEYSVIEAFAKEWEKKSERKHNYFYIINNTIHLPNGQTILIAEKTMAESHYDSATNTSRDEYATGNCIVICLDVDGNVHYVQQILKTFDDESAQQTSYAFAHFDNNLYLLYNDDKKWSEQRTLNEKAIGGINYFTDLAVIDDAGNVLSQKTLFNQKETGASFIPSYCIQDGSKMLVLLRRGPGKFKVGILRFN